MRIEGCALGPPYGFETGDRVLLVLNGARSLGAPDPHEPASTLLHDSNTALHHDGEQQTGNEPFEMVDPQVVRDVEVHQRVLAQSDGLVRREQGAR